MQAVTTAVGLEFGLASSLFAVALCFTLITMYDAAGVRYHSGVDALRCCLKLAYNNWIARCAKHAYVSATPSGKQAEVLNILLEDVVQGHPVTEQRLKEVLGHTPLQVGLAQLCCRIGFP